MWNLNRWACVAVLTLINGLAFAQGSTEYGSGLKIAFNKEETKYLRIVLWNQIWLRHMQLNPGSLINDEPRTNTWDIGARRIRLLAFAQLSPRYLIITHVGINNQTFATGGDPGSSGTGPLGAGKKPQVFFHDAWNEYAVIPEVDYATHEKNKFQLYVGGGLHYWWGISRMSSASTVNFLTIDAPIINWPLVEVSDQFVRQYGVYAKGRLGKISYSIALNKPFATNVAPTFDVVQNERVAVDNNDDPSPALTGYFDYQFFHQESNALPYRVGTYVGTQRVFNIGVGFYRHANGTKSIDGQGLIEQHNITLGGLDVFADLPVGNPEKNAAITAYAVLYHYDFGPNYWRALGVMNPSTAFDSSLPLDNRTLNGPGNGRVFVGTGNLFYTQAGYLIPKFKNERVRFQPFSAYTWKKLEYLDDDGHYFDFGFNVFFDGHHAKLTTQYSSRPLYYNQGGQRLQQNGRGEWLIQMQIFL
ncbi:MAG: porin [Cyclobacteriaceae bacterium]|nr:porin [Cyclobacteriaceae bacterium]